MSIEPAQLVDMREAIAELADKSVAVTRGGSAILTQNMIVQPFIPATIEGPVGRDPGLEMQEWLSFTADTPAAAIKVGDLLTVGGVGYTAATVDNYPPIVEVIGSRWLYDLTINVFDQAGTQVVTGWPALIMPRNQVQRSQEQQDTVRGTMDAVLRCAPNDAILPGRRVVVATVNGTAATAVQAVNYLVLSRDDLLSFGTQIECELQRQ